MAEGGSFKVNGKEYNFPTSLTMGEMCDAEQHFGVEFGNNKSSGVRMIAALIWIAVSRQDPTVTVEDIRGLPPEVFESFTEATGEVDPPASEPGSNEFSGNGSSNGLDHPEENQSRTGSPGSDTGATSDPLTSAA